MKRLFGARPAESFTRWKYWIAASPKRECALLGLERKLTSITNDRCLRDRRTILGTDEVIVGDLMLCEVLQGLEGERAARDVEALLRRFQIVSMVGDVIAVAGARNFPFLRRRGITVRKTIDLLIGTWCIENRTPLLHNDSDFRPMTRHLGLIEVPIAL